MSDLITNNMDSGLQANSTEGVKTKFSEFHTPASVLKPRIETLRLFAEIDLDAAIFNLGKLKELIKPRKTQICCVLKANGYGHDDCTLCRVLEENGVSMFAVSNIWEAVKLRQGGCEGDILILGYTHPDHTELLIKHNIIQTVTGLEHARVLCERLEVGRLRVHIKTDTGMGRLGIKLDDFERAKDEIVAIAALPGIVCEGIFTHLAAADSASPDDLDFTTAQTECFFYLTKECEQAGVNFIHRHTFNSAGGLMHYDPRSTLVRFGIALYGLKPDVSMNLPVKLRPVMSLKSHVAQVKTLHKGETVSYGRTFSAQREMTVAVVTVGYADGYPRALSSYGNSPNGFMIINGKKARILGRVCMDQTVVDVTDIPDVKVGTLVTLIGTDGGMTITADDLAVMADTIGYEIVCGIGLRVPRLIYKDNELINVVDYYSNAD
jgi:alanine racemase